MKTVDVRVFGAAWVPSLTMTVLCLAAGCQRKDIEVVRGEDFRPESERRSVAYFVEAQAASGARADATLRPYHFNGAELNSLGRAKLDLMLKDDEAAAPLLVFLEVPANYPLGENWRASATE